MKAIVDDYGDIGRRLLMLEHPLRMIEAEPVLPQSRAEAVAIMRQHSKDEAAALLRRCEADARARRDYVRSEALSRFEDFKRMREADMRPIMENMSLDAIREAVRMMMPSARSRDG